MLHALGNAHIEIGSMVTMPHLQNVWSGHSNTPITNKIQIHTGLPLKQELKILDTAILNTQEQKGGLQSAADINSKCLLYILNKVIVSIYHTPQEYKMFSSKYTTYRIYIIP
jgi:hypothetical protein